MNLTIIEAETTPNRTTVLKGDGRNLEESTRITTGTLETPYGVMEFDKYFTTKHTLKKRADFVVIRTDNVPALGETFARINRAASLGSRAIRQSNAFLGARLSPKTKTAACEADGGCGCIQNSSDMQFGVVLPVAVSELAGVSELDVKEDGEGLSWLRIFNRYFDLYADNPAMQDNSTYGLFIHTESPNMSHINLEHARWWYADALLTPSMAELPGALGDMSVRAALVGLKPGETNIS